MVAEAMGNLRVMLPPDASEEDAAVLRTRIWKAQQDYEARTGQALNIAITTNAQPSGMSALPQEHSASPALPRDDELTLEERARRYQATAPEYDPAMLVLPAEVREALQRALNHFHLFTRVFEDMGMKHVQPSPSFALNFHGEPGTGKTHAAHAIAAELGKPILTASYGDIDSKYRAEGPRNLQALFYAAQRDDAVLFMDDADALLSSRFVSVTQGAEEAANALRVELIRALDSFRGLFVSATNQIESYDTAFVSRFHSVHFPKPDRESRAAIWRAHLQFEHGPSLDSDVDFEALAEVDGIVGRDIRHAVIDAAYAAADRSNPATITQGDLLTAITRICASHPPQTAAFAPANISDPETAKRIRKAVKKRNSKSK